MARTHSPWKLRAGLVAGIIVGLLAFYAGANLVLSPPSAPSLNSHAQTACVPCPSGQSGCAPHCCPQGTVSVGSLSVTGLNSTYGTTATISWSDSPSSAGDQFFYGTSSNNLNLQATPSNHRVSLTGLTPYVHYYFHVHAYLACYVPGDAYSSGTPYYPHAVSIAVYVSNASGYIENYDTGQKFYNDSTMSLYSPLTTYLSGYVDSTHTGTPFFYNVTQWVTSQGTLASATNTLANKYTLFTAATTGSMLLEMNFTNGAWAGYELHHTGMDYVNATITLPSSTSFIDYSNGIQTAEGMSFWVGIGGTDAYGGPASGLFQAGVDIVYNSSTSSPWIYMFAANTIIPPGYTFATSPYYQQMSSEGQYIGSGGDVQIDTNPYFVPALSNSVPYGYQCGSEGAAYQPTFEPKLGDRLAISVGYWNITTIHKSGYYTMDLGPMGNFSFVDLSQKNHPTWGSGTYSLCLPYAADPNYGEVISEQPSCGYPCLLPSTSPPGFDNITFVNPGYSLTPSLGPYLQVDSCVAFPGKGGNGYWVEWQTPTYPSGTASRLSFTAPNSSYGYYSKAPAGCYVV